MYFKFFLKIVFKVKLVNANMEFYKQMINKNYQFELFTIMY